MGEHHRLLAGLHAVAESHSWSPMERQSLAFLLAGHGLLDDEEARWFAEDSSLRGHQGD